MLTPKQSTVCMLLALNSTQSEAAAKAGVSPLTVCKWMKLPEFQNVLQTYRQQMFDRLQAQTVEEVMADAPNTFTRLKELRDEKKNLNVALGACRELFARQIPARTQHEEDRTIRIILEKREEQHARAVLEEDRLLDIQEAEVVDAAPSS